MARDRDMDMNSKMLKVLKQMKKSKPLKDSLIIGLISGTVGAAAMELLSILFGKKLIFGKIASSIIFHPLRINSLKNILFGELMHLIAGAGIGSIIAALLKKTGKDFVIIKGTFVSLLTWVGLHNLGQRMGIFRLKPRSTKNHYFALFQHLVFGLTTSAVIKYLANPGSFQPASITRGKTPANERKLQCVQPFMPSDIDSYRRDRQVSQFKYPTA